MAARSFNDFLFLLIISGVLAKFLLESANSGAGLLSLGYQLEEPPVDLGQLGTKGHQIRIGLLGVAHADVSLCSR